MNLLFVFNATNRLSERKRKDEKLTRLSLAKIHSPHESNITNLKATATPRDGETTHSPWTVVPPRCPVRLPSSAVPAIALSSKLRRRSFEKPWPRVSPHPPSVMGSPIFLRLLLLLAAAAAVSSAPRREAFRRDPGHPHWHHGAFHDVEESIRADVRRMLHTRAEVLPRPFSRLVASPTEPLRRHTWCSYTSAIRYGCSF